MSTIEQLEQQKADLQQYAKLCKTVHRLLSDSEFKELLLNDYCVKESARFVGLATTNFTDNVEREHSLTLAQGCAYLGLWLQNILKAEDITLENIHRIDTLIEEERTTELKDI